MLLKESRAEQRIHELMEVTGFSHLVFPGTLGVPCFVILTSCFLMCFIARLNMVDFQVEEDLIFDVLFNSLSFNFSYPNQSFDADMN